MNGLLQKWREVAADYRQLKTIAEDHEDIVWALIFTIGTLACSAFVASIMGGHYE